MIHFAEVAVSVGPLTHAKIAVPDEVAVSDEVFAWRRDAYGPGAFSGGPADEALVAEAVEGVRYVLARRGPGDRRRVTVVRILDTLVDTGPGDVKFAAVMATCQALGVELDDPPFIDASGIVFPGQDGSAHHAAS